MIHSRITATALFALLATAGLRAQETLPATGGNAMGVGGSSSYTVGQTVYTTNSGTNGSAVQGVQQPYEISTSVGINMTEISLELIVYPNPAHNAIMLNIGLYNNEKLTYQLHDMQGKLLDSEQVVYCSTTIGLQDLPAGTYLLSVFDNLTSIKTFKIVKN